MSKAAEKLNRRGVLICGAYGMSNAGDEAVLDALLAEMRSIDAEMPITVLSRTPEDTGARHDVRAIHSFDLPGMLRAMRRSALYINGGGSLIQDVTSTRSLWYYLYTLVAAKHRGCKVMMYGCGIGPVNRPLNRRLAGWVIDRYVDAVTLREEHSLSELRSMGVTKPEVTVASDPALSLSPGPAEDVDMQCEKLGLEKGGKYFCICVRHWPGIREKAALFAAAADYAYEKYGLRPVLLSVNPRQDGEASRLVQSLMKAPCVLAEEPMGTGEVIGFLSRMCAVMAMRLHALVFSASQSVPLIGVSYDPKVTAFLEYISQANDIGFDRLERPEQLCALIDAALAVDRAALKAGTERIMAIERRNTETARRLLEECERG